MEKDNFFKNSFFLTASNISTGLLYKKVNTLPYVIMEDIYISKADNAYI